MESFDRHTITYLNMLLATNFLLTCMDEFEGTPIYRHEVKKLANKFRNELIKMTEDDMTKVWGTNDSVMYQLMDEQEKLFKELAVMRPETCEIVNEMIAKYKTTPTAIENWLNVKIVEG